MTRPSIIQDRTGWDFFDVDGEEHIEKEDEQQVFTCDEDAILHVLYRSLANLEGLISAALGIEEDGEDPDGYVLKGVVFARRVLEAVGNEYPELAKLWQETDRWGYVSEPDEDGE